MGVPAAFVPLAVDVARKVNRDEANTCLDQPAGRQATLAIGGSTVGSRSLISSRDRSKAFRTLAAASMPTAACAIGVQTAGCRRLLQAPRLPVQQLQQPMRSLRRVGGYVLGQAQFGNPKIGPIGILPDIEGIIRLAQEAGRLARRGELVEDDIRERDPGRDPRVVGRPETARPGTVTGEELRESRKMPLSFGGSWPLRLR